MEPLLAVAVDVSGSMRTFSIEILTFLQLRSLPTPNSESLSQSSYIWSRCRARYRRPCLPTTAGNTLRELKQGRSYGLDLQSSSHPEFFPGLVTSV